MIVERYLVIAEVVMKLLRFSKKWIFPTLLICLFFLLFLEAFWLGQTFIKEFKAPSLSTKAKYFLYEFALEKDSEKKQKIIEESSEKNLIIWPRNGITFSGQEHLNERILALVTTLFPDYQILTENEKKLLIHRLSKLQGELGEKIREDYILKNGEAIVPKFAENHPEIFGEMSYLWGGYLKRLYYVVSLDEQEQNFTLYFISLSNISEKAAFTKELVPPISALILTLLCIIGGGFFFLFQKNQNEKTLKEMLSFQKAFSRFVPTEFVRLLKKGDLREINFGDYSQREMTILFLDIRDFTTLSENMSPKDNFLFLNNFLKKIGPVIRENHGFIDKFLGDGIMALFPDDPAHGLDAAIEVLSQLKMYNKGRVRAGYPPVKIGLGLHTGEMILGTVGEQHRMETTVISDAVNTAARLEAETKNLGCSLLVSKELLHKVPRTSKYLARYVGKRPLKGKRDEIGIYEIYNADSQQTREKKTACKQEFEEGVRCFYLGEFRKAKKAFKHCLAINSKDRVASHFLEHIHQSPLSKKFKEIATIPFTLFRSKI